jgi:hypothetical protein
MAHCRWEAVEFADAHPSILSQPAHCHLYYLIATGETGDRNARTATRTATMLASAYTALTHR